jgi:putative nucleotidyltransferase with HDIG domain
VSDPVRFLAAFTQSLSTMSLYGPSHPASARSLDVAYQALLDLTPHDGRREFSFLGSEVVYGQEPIRELHDWEWASRLANAGVQRLEFADDVSRADFEAFLEAVLARLTLSTSDTAEARPGSPQSGVRFGALGIRGETRSLSAVPDEQPSPGARYDLTEEVETIQWMHSEVGDRGLLPLMEAEAVVRSLAVAMHGESEMLIPLLTLREFDEYTTTHSLNVSVLTMALAEALGLPARDVRAFGVAGLLHDLGKTRVPVDILNKPGLLSDAERLIMQSHTVEGAKIILTSDRQLDLAATVAYEHHVMLNGGGYPLRHIARDNHFASTLVHVCDVYDALRTKRPYRDPWLSEEVLAFIEAGAGHDFDPAIARVFVDLMRQLEGHIQRSTLGDLRGAVPAALAAAPTTPSHSHDLSAP